MNLPIFESLDQWQKLKVYLDYRISRLALKLDFETLDKSRNLFQNLPWNHAWGVPDKEIHSTAMYFLHKNIKIKNFEEFQEEDDWGETYIEKWYNRFKERIFK